MQSCKWYLVFGIWFLVFGIWEVISFWKMLVWLSIAWFHWWKWSAPVKIASAILLLWNIGNRIIRTSTGFTLPLHLTLLIKPLGTTVSKVHLSYSRIWLKCKFSPIFHDEMGGQNILRREFKFSLPGSLGISIICLPTKTRTSKHLKGRLGPSWDTFLDHV